jgi:hypothetical protein
MKALAIYFLSSLLLFGCLQASKQPLTFKSHVLHKFIAANGLKASNFDTLVIIPGAGCGGCIAEAESFYLKQKSTPKSLFIFTGITDQKLFNLKLGKHIKEKKNAIVDSGNVLINNGFNSIYPSIAHIKGEYIELSSFNQ